MKEEKAQTMLRMLPSLKKDLEKLAKEDRRSLNNYICNILEEHVARKNSSKS